MDIETVVARILNEQTKLRAVVEVPAKRPDEFLSVEQTGGSYGFMSELDVLVTCWAKTRKRAHAIVQTVLDCNECFLNEDNIFKVEVDNYYRDDDPDSGQPRYKVNFTFTLCD